LKRFAEPMRERWIISSENHKPANAIELKATPVGLPPATTPDFTFVDRLSGAPLQSLVVTLVVSPSMEYGLPTPALRSVDPRMIALRPACAPTPTRSPG
jgi:hypothetical protein